MIKNIFSEYSIIRASVDANYRIIYYKKFGEFNERQIYEKTQSLGYIIAEGPPAMYGETVLERQYDKEYFRPPRGSLVIDVGGAYGDTAVWYAKEFGANVIVFEPLKERYNAILKNADANGVSDKIKAYNVALGSGTQQKGNLWKGMFTVLDGDIILETKRLDDFGLKDVWLLKIDVEGFEYEVLRGAIDTINNSNPKIILEAHSSKLKKECIELLSELGYELKYVDKTQRCTNQKFDLVQVLFFEHT
ncbi:MAG: FkbM family methyltransferase [Nitrososphaeria archaeon]